MLLQQFIRRQAKVRPKAVALRLRSANLSYEELWASVELCARGLVSLGLNRSERVAVYLPKQFETVIGLFGVAAAGGVFVPINPVLKPHQVAYILKDCNARVLITSSDRLVPLSDSLLDCHDLQHIVVMSGNGGGLPSALISRVVVWEELIRAGHERFKLHQRIDTDIVAILYTSGSTGRPKGVVLSHRNLVAGARSVAEYLENVPEDRLLAVLPFSFDYGLSQLTTAFSVGASVVLMDYLLPRDVIKGVATEEITGLAAVPPLWIQLAQLEWPESARTLRYITNSGGKLPIATIRMLRKVLPKTRIYLMYGLTEAFRSTYLPPDQVDSRPDSIGKAIPNVEVRVVRADGSECAPGEPGELVHRGSLVALGYWNDPEKTAERFRPVPGQPPELPIQEIAVWSGDQVRQDEEGYLYFVGRQDELIKTSGYRVSPTEIEEVIYASELAVEAVALGAPHPTLGQGIVVVLQPTVKGADTKESLLAYCRDQLPNFMVPQAFVFRDALPRNANGKIDRRALADELQDIFEAEASS